MSSDGETGFPGDAPLSRRALTMDAAIRDRVADSAERTFLRFDDATWTFADAYREACRFANVFLNLRDEARPFHVGVLMDNIPAFIFAEIGCGLAKAVLVGLNPTRTGSVLARDIAYADCQIIVVEERYAEQLEDALVDRTAGAPVQVLVVDGPARCEQKHVYRRCLGGIASLKVVEIRSFPSQPLAGGVFGLRGVESGG